MKSRQIICSVHQKNITKKVYNNEFNKLVNQNGHYIYEF